MTHSTSKGLCISATGPAPAPTHFLGKAPDPADTFVGTGSLEDALDAAEWLALWAFARGKETDALQENDKIPAGFTYLGQFITHDLTLNAQQLDLQGQPTKANNVNTPILDLDTVYRGGPEVSPHLYEPVGKGKDFGAAKRTKLRIGETQPDPTGKRLPKDLPRVCTEDLFSADLCPIRSRHLRFETLIGDERNEENLIIAQILLQFHKLHNLFAEAYAGLSSDPREIFDTARWLTTATYLRIIEKDYLPRILEPATCDTYQNAGQYLYAPNFLDIEKPGLPAEFTLAAMRMGHAMVRQVYSFPSPNDPFQRSPIQNLMRFNEARKGASAQIPITRDWVLNDWDTFFSDSAQYSEKSRKIRVAFAPDLGLTRLFPAHDDKAGKSYKGGLFFRDLARGLINRLPNGHAFAQRIGIPADKRLSEDDLAAFLKAHAEEPDDKKIAHLAKRPPLIFYLLAEAELKMDGERLGALGSTIIAETLFSVLAKSRDALGPMPELAKKHDAYDDEGKLPATMGDAIKLIEGDTMKIVIKPESYKNAGQMMLDLAKEGHDPDDLTAYLAKHGVTLPDGVKPVLIRDTADTYHIVVRDYETMQDRLDKVSAPNGAYSFPEGVEGLYESFFTDTESFEGPDNVDARVELFLSRIGDYTFGSCA